MGLLRLPVAAHVLLRGRAQVSARGHGSGVHPVQSQQERAAVGCSLRRSFGVPPGERGQEAVRLVHFPAVAADRRGEGLLRRRRRAVLRLDGGLHERAPLAGRVRRLLHDYPVLDHERPIFGGHHRQSRHRGRQPADDGLHDLLRALVHHVPHDVEAARERAALPLGL